MKISVIGLGKMGLLHSGILNSLPNVSVASVCETELFLSAAAKIILPKGATIYRDAQEMIDEEDPDAVYVTTPIDTHATIVENLLRTKLNLNVFVEKPLAASSEQAKIMCDAASRSRGVNMVGFQRRFSPIYRKAKELLMNETLGRPIFFRAYCFSSDVLRDGSAWRSKRASGGVLLDLSPHLLDILIWFFGDPSSTEAVKKQIHSREVEDYVHAILSYKSDLQGHLDVCWSVSNYRLPQVLLEVYATNGILTVTDDFVKVSSSKQFSVDDEESRIYHKQSFQVPIPFLLTDPEYTLEDVAFLEAIRTQATPETSFVQAAKVNTLIDKILANST
ncbi:MAG TPA: Gfo/Idh/MocA family oxidoreductase [Candidatus Bathyarchaeia archaeon]|nr:Gfo/Idh/MocA family oxidoreductase [Candidatus Bathyarchaeia archaeon]